MRTALAILLALLLAGCESKPRGPVALERDDACAFCRMAISEHRYASELLDANGEVYKFDDIGCMLRFAQSHGVQPSNAKLYVTDYASGNEWIDATKAHFVRLRSSVSSPMASGIVAFQSANSAEGGSSQKGGSPLTFQEVWLEQTSKLDASSQRRGNPSRDSYGR